MVASVDQRRQNYQLTNIRNLVRNAAEAMAGSPRRALTVTATVTPTYLVQVSVADTGPGLSPEVQAKLFQPFVTTKPRGLGVGLSICRFIVEAHGGELRAEANSGGGTIFLFTLATAGLIVEAEGEGRSAQGPFR